MHTRAGYVQLLRLISMASDAALYDHRDQTRTYDQVVCAMDRVGSGDREDLERV